MEYKISIDVFSGPMDLLLHLIEKDEIDIYDIPINHIAQGFMDYIHQIEELNLELTSDFLVMAATLLEIKSKMLLPKTSNKPDLFTTEEEDPREELVKRIVEYKKYKSAAEELKLLETIQYKVFYKPKEDLGYFEEEYEQLEMEGLEIDLLVKSLEKIIDKKGKENKLIFTQGIQREEYTLEKCIPLIKERLDRDGQFTFASLLEGETSRSQIIAYFLSILELIRMKYINLVQEEDFSDLIISKRLEERH